MRRPLLALGLLICVALGGALQGACAARGSREPAAARGVGEGGIEGIVVAGADGHALERVRVELYRGGIGDTDVDWWMGWGKDERERQRLAVTTTDEGGRFRLQTSAGGELLLRAAGGPGQQVLHALEHAAGESTADLELFLPAGVVVAGRVIAPPGVTLEGLDVRAGGAETVGSMPAADWSRGFDDFLEARVAPDGSFRIGPLGCGSIRLGLVRIESPPGRAPRRATLLAREVVVNDPGEVRLELDLSATWPGDLAVTVLASGAPVPEARVVLVRSHELDDGARRSEPVDMAFGPLASFQPMAGEYGLRIEHYSSLWSWEDPVPVRVAPGGRSERVVELPFVRGELRVLDETTREPLRGTRVVLLRQQGDEVRDWRCTTDGDGRLELVAPPGPVWIVRSTDVEPGPSDTADLAGLPRLEWPEHGLVAREVVLP